MLLYSARLVDDSILKLLKFCDKKVIAHADWISDVGFNMLVLLTIEVPAFVIRIRFM